MQLSPASNSSNHSAYPVGHVSGGGLGPGGSKKDLAGNNFNQEFVSLFGPCSLAETGLPATGKFELKV